METATQQRSLKVTIKLKRDKISTPSTVADQQNIVEGETNVANDSNLPEGQTTSSHDPGLSSADGLKNNSTEDAENPSSDISQYQIVVYDPSVNGYGNAETEPDPISFQPPPRRPHPFSNQTQRVLPSVGAFTVQCANCFKWRLIPTKEKYEEIREHIMEQPFSCDTAREWRPEVSCDDPPDITQDGSRLWAIDKPSIAQPPPGWQRLLRIRGEGSSKFADVYYVAPTGKRLRSMVEIQKYLNDHPEYIQQGVTMSQFSFQIPRPLHDNYVRKRPSRPAPLNDASDNNGTPGYLPASEAVRRLEWVRPDVDTELQLSGPGLSADHFEANSSNSEIQSAKKKKTPSKRKYNGDVTHAQNVVNHEEPPHNWV